MALDVSALTAYTDEISSGLTKQIVLGPDTVKRQLVTIKYNGIGSIYKLNFVRNTPVGTNALCPTSDLSTTILGQGTVTMCPISFPESICLETLKGYYSDWYASREYMPENLSGEFREVMAATRLEATALELEKIMWQGDGGAVLTGNLALCTGFIFNAAALTGEVIVTRAAMTTSNSVAYINSIIAVAPEQTLDKLEIYLSPRDFQSYLVDLVNNYKYNMNLIDTKQVKSIYHPGSIGVTVHSVSGMSGVTSGTFIATPKENIVLVFASNEELEYNEWYSRDLQALKVVNKTKMGTGFYFPELVVRSS